MLDIGTAKLAAPIFPYNLEEDCMKESVKNALIGITIGAIVAVAAIVAILYAYGRALGS